MKSSTYMRIEMNDSSFSFQSSDAIAESPSFFARERTKACFESFGNQISFGFFNNQVRRNLLAEFKGEI